MPVHVLHHRGRLVGLRADRGGELVPPGPKFLRARLPAPDSHLDVLADIVRTMLEDPVVVRVDELAARHATSPRSLRRLFRR